MILVAGGTGRLGREVVAGLSSRGLQIRVLTRNLEHARREIPGVELVRGDARRPASLPPALEGVDIVISLITGFGPRGGGTGPVDYQANINLIKASEAAGCRRFVLVSMRGASPDHPMELIRMKYRAEEAVRASRLEWVIIRPTVFLELWAGLVGDPILKSGKATVFGGGANPVNFVSVKDLASFVEMAVVDERLTRVVLEVGGPENLTFKELIEKVERITGRRAKVRYVPLRLMRVARRLLKPVRPDVAGMIEAGIVMDTVDMSFDTRRLQERFPEIQLTGSESAVSRVLFPASAGGAGTSWGGSHPSRSPVTRRL